MVGHDVSLVLAMLMDAERSLRHWLGLLAGGSGAGVIFSPTPPQVEYG